MISVRSVFRQVPDPRGKQGLQHPLEALLGLILLSIPLLPQNPNFFMSYEAEIV
jgi:hypothetical protein